MIIEVTGITGVGKSSLISYLFENLSQNSDYVFFNNDFNNKKNIPFWILYLSKNNLKTDIILSFVSIFFIIKNIKFTYYILKLIIKSKYLKDYKLILVRVFFRRMGFYNLLNFKCFKNKTFFIDEGLFHLSHNVLCSPYGMSTKSSIFKFLKLCPFDGKLIILNSKTKEVLIRLKKRGDFSPRVKNEEDINTFLENAASLFSHIIKNIKFLNYDYFISDSFSDKNILKFINNE